jgi:hypothetical protein
VRRAGGDHEDVVRQLAVVEHDAPARALLGMLHQADVMQGDAQGRVIAQASLRIEGA